MSPKAEKKSKTEDGTRPAPGVQQRRSRKDRRKPVLRNGKLLSVRKQMRLKIEQEMVKASIARIGKLLSVVDVQTVIAVELSIANMIKSAAGL